MSRHWPAAQLRAAGRWAGPAGIMGATEDERDPARAAPRQEGGVDAAFDLWLRRGLHQLYDAVAQEPIPPELLRMIEEDRSLRNQQKK